MEFVTLGRERTHPRAEYMSHYKRRELVMTKSTQTLTQSGLLAVLLQRQRYRIIQLARRRAQGKRLRAAFWNTLNWPHAKAGRSSAPHMNLSPG